MSATDSEMAGLINDVVSNTNGDPGAVLAGVFVSASLSPSWETDPVVSYRHHLQMYIGFMDAGRES